MEICHKAVMDILVATDVGKFPPKMRHGGRSGQSFFSISISISIFLFFSFSLSLFLLSAGTKGSWWELRHLTGSPGGGGG